MTPQELLVSLVISAAVLTVGRSLYRTIKGGEGGCGAGCGCGAPLRLGKRTELTSLTVSAPPNDGSDAEAGK